MTPNRRQAAELTQTRPQESQAGLRVLCALVVTAAFYPYLFAQIAPARAVLLISLVALILACVQPKGPMPRSSGTGIFYVAVTLSVGYGILLLFSEPASPVSVSNYQRIAVLFPVAALAGWALASRAGLETFSKVYALISSATAALACVEFFAGRSLFGREEIFLHLERAGRFRAVLGADHALTLSVLLVAGIPFISKSFTGKLRAFGIVLSLTAIWATDSRGSLAIGMVTAVICSSDRLLAWIQQARQRVLAFGAIGVAVLAYYAVTVWEPITPSRDASTNSLEYRAAIYSLAPRILSSQPFGYGLGDLPPGQWLIQGEGQVRDLTTSVDSQVVLGILRLGWIGLAAITVTWLLAVMCARTSPHLSMVALTLCGAGLFVAMDSWDGLGSIWALITGMSLRLASRESGAQNMDGAQLPQN